jgi:hypothetical protein
MWWFEALLMANEPKKICLGPKALFFLSSHGTHLETYSYYENVPMVPNATILQLMQLYCNYILKYWWVVKCNYIATYATICNYIATYATILQQFRMQLYATMKLCNMQLTQLYATILQLYATRCGNFNFMQLYVDG